MAASDALLEVIGLRTDYGSSRVLHGVSFSVAGGTGVAVLGANGAGKSTLARTISGLAAPKSGSINFAGTSIFGLEPHRIRRMGLVYLPEERGIFPALSVADNVRMAVRWLGSSRARAEAVERAYALFPVLWERRPQRASSLSGGEQQMLSLACGLAVEPRLVIADEMSLGLAPMVVDTVLAALDAARHAGTAVLLIEQYVERALTFADSCMILERGEIVWEGAPDAAGRAAREQYLGYGEQSSIEGPASAF